MRRRHLPARRRLFATTTQNARHQLGGLSTWKTVETVGGPETGGIDAIGLGSPWNLANIAGKAQGQLGIAGNVQNRKSGSPGIPHSVRYFQRATGETGSVSDVAESRIWNPLAVRWIGFLRQPPAPDTSPARRHECLPTHEPVS